LHYDAAQVSTALTWAGLGYAAGSCLAGIVADRLGTRRTYVLGLLISLAFLFPVFALPAGNVLALWVLLFVMQATSQGISGLLPKYIGDHFPTRLRAAGLGFSYNVGALGRPAGRRVHRRQHRRAGRGAHRARRQPHRGGRTDHRLRPAGPPRPGTGRRASTRPRRSEYPCLIWPPGCAVWSRRWSLRWMRTGKWMSRHCAGCSPCS
jgi:hypothetical protein